ncbi:MAG TPA: fatty acid desaturase [Tepidisphaeraceae bacterium]|jgi:hypothetical protein|nr:fatty acid desaturase [Tepidisphaeraceae bacterium]
MSSIQVHLGARHASDSSPRRASPLLHSRWDLLLISPAFVHGAALLLYPSPILIAIGIWWNANTIAHNFIHRPFFSPRWINRLFSLYLSLLLGIPQSLWRQRHLAHHADRPWKLQLNRQLLLESLAVGGLWLSLAILSPYFFLTAYLPGYFCGLILCWLQGRYEHVRGTTSHYGRLYNFLFFNDGYHVEHHARPGVHWRDLARSPHMDDRASPWPAVFRWIEGILGALERLVLRSNLLQQFVINRHEQAIRRLSKTMPPPNRIGVVGGGLFPRSLIVLKRIYPTAEILAIEGSHPHIEIARRFVEPDVQFVNEWFDPHHHHDFDLLVIPLAYLGSRDEIYQNPPTQRVLIHDWIWRRLGPGAIVSILLLKRINLVTRCQPPPSS